MRCLHGPPSPLVPTLTRQIRNFSVDVLEKPHQKDQNGKSKDGGGGGARRPRWSAGFRHVGSSRGAKPLRSAIKRKIHLNSPQRVLSSITTHTHTHTPPSWRTAPPTLRLFFHHRPRIICGFHHPLPERSLRHSARARLTSPGQRQQHFRGRSRYRLNVPTTLTFPTLTRLASLPSASPSSFTLISSTSHSLKAREEITTTTTAAKPPYPDPDSLLSRTSFLFPVCPHTPCPHRRQHNSKTRHDAHMATSPNKFK